LAIRVFAVRAELPVAPRPEHPVVIWNPRSGGGKALNAGLPDEAPARAIRTRPVLGPRGRCGLPNRVPNKDCDPRVSKRRA